MELAKSSDDPKTRSKANCLATYEILNFKFLLGMNIWYDTLFAINPISKYLQYKEMQIDIAINKQKGLITIFENYRENG